MENENKEKQESQSTNSLTGAYIQVPQYTPKEYKPLDKKDIIFMVLFLISTVVSVDFALFHSMNLGFFIAYTLLMAFTAAYIYDKNSKPDLFTMLCGGLSLIGAFSFVLFSDSLMKTFMFILVGMLFSIFSLGLGRGYGGNGGSFKMMLDVSKSVITEPFENIGDVFGSAKVSAQNNKKSFSSIIGALVAVPVLCVVIPLLSKSDAAFEGLVTTVIQNIGEYLFEIVLGIILLIYVYPFAFAHRHSEKSKKTKKTIKKLFAASGCASFLGVISFVYIVYIFSQLAYFFSAFGGILPDNYKYSASEFARRGFYEMFAICVINVIIISLVSIFSKKKSTAIKALSGFVSFFSVLLIVVAIQKMRLNISIFGLSENRILVFTFMLMVLVVIAFFIIHIFAPKVNYMKPIIIICSVMFIALTFSNIGSVAANYNVKAFNSKSISTLDIENIADTGDAGVPVLIELCSSKDNNISTKSKHELAYILTNSYYSTFEVSYESKTISYNKDNDFRSFNLSRRRAEKAMYDYYLSLGAKEKEDFIDCCQYEDNCYYYDDDDNTDYETETA